MKIEQTTLEVDGSNAELTGYILDDSAEMLKGKPRPAVIICPGGGYFSCSDREGEPVAMYFASLGYQAFVLRYTTYANGGLEMPDLSKPLPPHENDIFPKQIRQLGKAVLTVKEHAEEWHVDAGKVMVCGFSAGGHVAALYATRYDEPVLMDYLHASEEQLRPAAAIVGYPLTDYALLEKDLEAKKDTSPMDYAFMKASNVAFLGMESPDDELIEEVSAVRHVDSKTPPFFIWTTATDPLVNPVHSLSMAVALANQGIPYEIHVFGNGMHGLSLASQASAESQSQIKPDVSQWTEACAVWMKKNFPLDLPALGDFEKMIASQNADKE